MNILLLGSGGREHAIAWKIAQSPKVEKLFIAPGNAGTAQTGTNVNIKAEGDNEHHKIEGIFKALARALKMAVKRDIHHFELPSTKGML